MTDTQWADGNKNPAPPYIAFQSLKTLAEDMKEHGLPARIDSSVLTNFSGSVASQIMTALKFLHLTGLDGKPTGQMKQLVDAYGTDQWEKILSKVVRDAYAPLFDLDLETASPALFMERFRTTYPGKDDVVRKCMTFFLKATQETDIKISPYIMKSKKTRTTPPKRRPTKNGGKAKGQQKGSQDDPPLRENPTDSLGSKSPSELLLALFDPNEMGEAEQDAVWTLLKHFKSKEQ